jgi:hypothetical protein
LASIGGRRAIVYDFLVKGVAVSLFLRDTQGSAFYGVHEAVFGAMLRRVFYAAVESDCGGRSIVVPHVERYTLPSIELARILAPLRIILIRRVTNPLPLCFVWGTVVDHYAIACAWALLVVIRRLGATP